jgi:tight adherence protein B
MLALFFLVTTSMCFALVMWTLRPAPSAERVRLRLAAVQRMYRAAQHQDDTEMQMLHDNWHTRLETRLLKTRLGRGLADLLLQSRSGRTLPAFFAISAGFAVCTGTIAGVGFKSPLAGAGAAALAAPAYAMILNMRRKRRAEKFSKQLPAAASMMARALRAGHSVAQMLALAAEQSKDPLREDFAQLSQEQRLGVPLRDALLSLSRRVPLPDLRFLVSAIVIQKEVGGDLIQVLERTAALIQDRLRIHEQVRTYTAQGRMSAWVLTALPIALLVLLAIAIPGYANTIFHDPAGQRMLMVGCALLVMGAVVIRRIVNIKV